MLGLRSSTAGDTGSIPGQGSKILHTSQLSKEKKKELKKNQVFLLRKKKKLVETWDDYLLVRLEALESFAQQSYS